VGLHGNDPILEHPRTPSCPHHERHVRAVDVHVHEADLVPALLEGEGEVDGDRRFAHAALAR